MSSFFQKLFRCSKAKNEAKNEATATTPHQMPPGQEKKQKDFLRQVAFGDIGYFSLEDHECWARVISQYDGDSFTAIFFYEDHPYKFKIRLSGIDTAEKRAKNPLEKAHANRARERLKELINDELIWINCKGADKYGRILAEVFYDQNEWPSFNDILVNEGLAYEYHGDTKKEFSEWAPCWALRPRESAEREKEPEPEAEA